jgi:hypothetical protein
VIYWYRISENAIGKFKVLAKTTDLNDVAILWPRSRTINGVRRSGRCPSYSFPLHLRVPGGRVELADEDGSVRLIFRVARIEKGVPVTAADGKQYERGNVLVATEGSVRSPGKGDRKYLGVNPHAAGAFAYFDPITRMRVVYRPGTGKADSKYPKRPGHHRFAPRLYPLFANNIGQTLSQPERCLIRAYTSWIGDTSMFGHHKALKKSGLYTDLFLRSRRTLFEAKATMGRRILREAIGQLYDYQRYYPRSPHLAILLPQRPSLTLMKLFERMRIIVVWRSRGESFSDSADGVLTKHLRNIARTRLA